MFRIRAKFDKNRYLAPISTARVRGRVEHDNPGVDSESESFSGERYSLQMCSW